MLRACREIPHRGWDLRSQITHNTRKHVRGAKTRQVAPETRAQRNEHLKRLQKRRKTGRSQLKGL